MSDLNFYTVSLNYVGFLKKAELEKRGFSRVPDMEYAGHRKPKSLCGIVLQVNCVDYYVPLTSYKKKKPDNFLIKADNGEVVSSLRFNYMFPIPKEFACVRVISNELDISYRSLLAQELRFCIKNQSIIKQLAERTYKRVLLGKDKGLVVNSCDFLLLEQKCKEYFIETETAPITAKAKKPEKLPTGKLDSELLEDIVFKNIRFKRPEVLVRPGIGEDCAVLDFGGYECVISTDPITAAISDIGRLAVHISCNDIASNGVEPLGIMLAVMLPVGTTEDEIREMMRQAGAASAELGVEIIGGHTEITPAVKQPVIVSTAIGRALSGSSQKAENMRPGDLIYMTKWAGLEGTGILANDHQQRLDAVLTADELNEAKELLDMVSVVKEGVAAGKVGTCGMHDVTEGGVLGAVWEMCMISGTGAEIHEDKIPILEVTKKICGVFGINPLRLISSGCMMIVVSPENKEVLENALSARDVKASHIGTVREAAFGLKLMRCDGVSEISPPESDELYKAL